MTPDHFHCCRQLRGSYVTDRHNGLLYTLEYLAHKARCAVHIEPRTTWEGYEDEDHSRVDAIISGSGIPPHHMVDASLIHPCAPSYLPKGRYARDREKAKRTRYAAMVERAEHKFTPFVLETYGAMGLPAQDFLRWLANEHSDDETASDAFYRHGMAAISFALARGNAHISSQGVLRQQRLEQSGSGGGSALGLRSAAPAAAPSVGRGPVGRRASLPFARRLTFAP